MFADDEPQYEVHLICPEENGRLKSLFHLVRAVYDSFNFSLVGDRFVFESKGIADTPWHTDLGRMIERHFQPELRQLMHQDWDQFSLIWNDTSYLSLVERPL